MGLRDLQFAGFCFICISLNDLTFSDLGLFEEGGSKTEDKVGALTTAEAGFVLRTWFVNGMPFNQDATGGNLYLYTDL